MKYLFPKVICHKTLPITKMHFQIYTNTRTHWNNKLYYDYLLLKYTSIGTMEIYYGNFGSIKYDLKYVHTFFFLLK